MGFLAPWFLAGLAALGIPVYLHLLQKHRTVPLRFSSLMMFERRTQSSVKHRRLRYLLLFALRMALLLLLVLAFANPFVMRAVPPGSTGQRIQVLAIDHSFSMRANAGGSSRLEQAKQQALQVLGSLGRIAPRCWNWTIRCTYSPRRSRSRPSCALPCSRFSPATRAVRMPSWHGRCGRSRSPRALRWWCICLAICRSRPCRPAFADLRLAPGIELVLHPVAAGPTPNFVVEQVSAPRRVSDASKARVQATVAGFGTPAARRTVSLVLNGKVASSKTVDVPENGRASVEFIGLDATYGLNRGEVRIDSADPAGGRRSLLFRGGTFRSQEGVVRARGQAGPGGFVRPQCDGGLSGRGFQSGAGDDRAGGQRGSFPLCGRGRFRRLLPAAGFSESVGQLCESRRRGVVRSGAGGGHAHADSAV